MVALLASSSAFASPAPGTHFPSTFGTSNAAPAPNWDVNAFDAATGGSMPDDATTDTPTVTVSFNMSGTVAQNCSYFSNSTNNQQSISLGAIGIKNGNSQNIGSLFNQIDPIDFEITSTNAGCNTDNTVTVSKGANGLSNPTTSGFDSSQFTNSIPYSIKVGVAAATPAGTVGTGQFQGFTVPTTATTGSANYGAWRSKLDLTANIPAQSLGLVAGTYSDTITVTLAPVVSGGST
jgi:hypothetical protein